MPNINSSDMPWRDAVINAVIDNVVYRAEHETNPRWALVDLIESEKRKALDTRISKAAADLVCERADSVFDVVVLKALFHYAELVVQREKEREAHDVTNGRQQYTRGLELFIADALHDLERVLIDSHEKKKG